MNQDTWPFDIYENFKNACAVVSQGNIEHPAITECLRSYMEGHLTPKITVTYVEVNREGIVSTQDVLDALRPNTALVTIMTGGYPLLDSYSSWQLTNISPPFR